MFSLASGIYQSYFAPPKLSILIIGLDGSGKTSLLERIKVTNINTRLVVTTNNNNSTAPSSSSSTIISPTLYYGKDCAVAGIVESSTGDDNNTKRQQNNNNGGKPARLPPPLPPKLAIKSHHIVEQMLVDGFSGTSTSATAATKREELINSVPLPPLTNHSLSSSDNNNEVSSQTKEKKNDRNKPSPLPPRHDSISSGGSTTTTPIKKPTKSALTSSPAATVKKNSFIELLRCPSPKKYSDAAIVDDEDEDDEYQDLVDTTTTIPNNSNNGNTTTTTPWSIEYLRDYYINYQPHEEFDNTIKASVRGSNKKGMKKMFPIDKIRPTLGQNLAKLDLCGCKCSLFDLSGAEKMRPLWERYYRDTDAIIYVVNAAETSISKLHQSRRNFEQMCNNDALQRRVRCGLPILIFANQLDVAYMEYEDSMNKANSNSSQQRNDQRGISWNADEEDDFIGGTTNNKLPDAKTNDDNNDNEESSISKRVVDFHDLATLFGFPQHSISSMCDEVGGQSIPVAHQGNIFLFGGSAKSGEGVRASMEFLTMAAKNYHLGIEARK